MATNLQSERRRKKLLAVSITAQQIAGLPGAVAEQWWDGCRQPSCRSVDVSHQMLLLLLPHRATQSHPTTSSAL